MKVVEIREGFGLENLAVAERAELVPGPGQVAVRVRACSLNYRDLLMVTGRYNPKQKLPLVPLSDGVGIVTALGPGASRVKVGDRVAATFMQDFVSRPLPRDGSHLKRTLGGPLDGMLAEAVVLGEQGVVPVPAHLSDAQAATLPCAAVTAWSALVGQGGLRAGDTVVVQGTGGVSIFALQIARLSGARVCALSRSDAKLDRARALGADWTINTTTTPEWGDEVRKLTGGADHVIDVGGAQTLAQSLRAVRAGGTISSIGMLSGSKAEIELNALYMRNVRLQGVFVGSRDEFEALCRAVERARLEPVVDRAFPMDDARAAFAYFGEGKHFGKVCIEVSR